MERLREFIELRLEWLDEQFATLESFRTSLGYYVTSDLVQVAEVDTESGEGFTEIRVTTEDEAAAAVSVQVNGSHFYTADLENGSALIRVSDAVLRGDGQENMAQVRLLDGDGAYLVNEEGSTKGEYTNGISTYVCFAK